MRYLYVFFTLLPLLSPAAEKPIKLFILARDELVLEPSSIESEKLGELASVIADDPKYSFLRGPSGCWTTRDNVVLFDAHPFHHNTESSGRFLGGCDVAYGGRRPRGTIGIEQSLGHAFGRHFEKPLIPLRFGIHPSQFKRGSRSLAHDYMPPSADDLPAADGTSSISTGASGTSPTPIQNRMISGTVV